MYLSKRNGIYYVFYRKKDGKKTCKSTKKAKKKDAFVYLTTFKKHLEEQSKVPNLTVDEFETILLKRIDHSHTMGSLKLVKGSFKQFKQFIGKDMPIRDITIAQVQDFVGTTFARTKHGAALYYRHLKSAFNMAINLGYLPENQNPFVKVKLPKIPTNAPLFITKDELNLIVSEEPRDIFKFIFELAFYTGMRLSEITHLNWNQVNLSEQFIEVLNSDQFTSKSKSSRKIYLTEYIVARLQKLKNDNDKGYVFQKSNEERYSRTYVSKRMKRALRKTHLNSKIHFHSLRHSFASRLVQQGASLYSVQILLGHSSPILTQRYAHLSSDNLKKTITLLEN